MQELVMQSLNQYDKGEWHVIVRTAFKQSQREGEMKD
jgi:hypothetical protein